MKHNYLLLSAIATFVSTTALAQKPIMDQTQTQNFWQVNHNNKDAKPALKRIANGENRKIAATRGVPFDLITDQPAGELKTMVGNLGGYYSIMGYILSKRDDGRAVDVVYGDNNYIYIHNPFSQFSTNSWLKGSIKGDTIYVDAQPIYYEPKTDEYEEAICMAAKMKYGYVEEKAQNYWSLDLDDPTMKFVVRNDSIIMVNDNGYSALGMFYTDGEWTGFGEYRRILTPQTDEIVKLSASAESAKDYVLTYDTYYLGSDTPSKVQQLVKLAKDGNDYYLSDLTATNDGLYVKGTLNDNKLTFKSGQYMGVAVADKSNDFRYHNYFEAMSWERVKSEDYYGNEYTDKLSFKDDFSFDYDASDESFEGENNYFSVNGGKSAVNVRNGFKTPYLDPFVKVEAAPAKPGIHNVDDAYEESGYSYIECNLTNTTENGEFLDTRRIYYYITIDDELLVFSPDEYVSIKEDTKFIPYSYVDNEDFQTYKGRRVVYFFTTEFKKVGLQEFYLGEDGTKYHSEPAFWYKNAAGITKATSSAASTRYYDLSGRLVSNPQHGIYIKHVTNLDGTISTRKIIK